MIATGEQRNTHVFLFVSPSSPFLHPSLSTHLSSLSPCPSHLVFVQCVAIWDWTTEGESPSVSVTLDSHLNNQVNNS